MIKEAYCSFEVAKLLKEKGFKEITADGYDIKGKELDGMISSISWNEDPMVKQGFPEFKTFAKTTHQMAMKWLREVHNIDIDIEAAVGMLGVKVYVPYISTYKPLEGASSKVHQIKRGIHYKDDRGVILALQHFDSYEEAVEVALKYVLENLI